MYRVCKFKLSFIVVIILIFTSCAHFSKTNRIIILPQINNDRDIFELVIDAAKEVNLPPVTRVDKQNGILEFGKFGGPITGYTAQVRLVANGKLDITVMRGSVYVPLGTDKKADEFIAAINKRIKQ